MLTDGTCPVCRRFGAWVAARDRRQWVQVVDLGVPGLAARFAGIDLGLAAKELTVIDATGLVCRGVAALRRLGTCLPGLRHLDWAYRLPGVEALVGGAYGVVNRARRGACAGCGDVGWAAPVHQDSDRR